MADKHSSVRSWRRDSSWCGVRVQIRIDPKHLDLAHSLMVFYQVSTYQELFEEILESDEVLRGLLRSARAETPIGGE